MNSDPLHPDGIPEESKVLLAEQALSLPNVTDFQYYPRGNEQAMHYFYRGEGEHRNVLIEVVVYPDRRSVIRYHHYKSDKLYDSLPELGSNSNSSVANTSGLKEKIAETILTRDINLDAQTEASLNEKMSLSTEAQLKLREQSARVKLRDTTGKDWVTVDAAHLSDKNVSFTTVVPVEWNINDNGLKVDGNVRHARSGSYEEGVPYGETAAVLALTDHNHEYLKTSVVSRGEAEEIIALSSRFSFGKYGNVEASAEEDMFNKRSYSVGHRLNDKNGSLSTKIGVDEEKSKYFEFQKETKLSENSSMILTLRTTDDHETYVMYQYKALLR